MDSEKLIERLKSKDFERDYDCTPFECGVFGLLDDAATALSTLQAENEEMQKQLNEFSEFLCHMTGGLLSKTNYTAQEMISAAEDYQQKVCGECDLRAENENLRAELEQVKRERDAAVSDLETVMAYGGGNLDTCTFCKNGQCYERGGTKLCNPEWRGQKED